MPVIFRTFVALSLIFWGLIQPNMAQTEPDIQAVKDKKLPYQYWVYYPKGYHDKANKEKTYPLLIYLHGRSIMGKNLDKVKPTNL